MNNQTENSNQPNGNNKDQQIQWLVIVVSLLAILLLFFLYCWVYNFSFKQGILELLNDVIPGAVGGILSYLLIYFIFLRKGIPVNLDQQLASLQQDIKEDISNMPGPTLKYLNEKVKQKDDSDIKLYTFCGLQDKLSTDPILQDFSMKGRNINAIQYLWVDAGNKLEPSINHQNNSLHIEFDNKSPGGSNLAIRPSTGKGRTKLQNMNYLTFEVNITEENKNVLLGFRLINGWLQHWHYANGHDSFITLLLGQYLNTGVNTNSWKSFSLAIEKPDKWSLFPRDGNRNYGPEEADFSIIASIVFEFGCLEGISINDYQNLSLKHRPGIGKGEVEIRNLKLTESIGDYLVE